jgi:hypothetical protein
MSPVVEIDQRRAGDLTVTLYWHTEARECMVTMVVDEDNFPPVAMVVPESLGKDAYDHPYIYLSKVDAGSIETVALDDDEGEL